MVDRLIKKMQAWRVPTVRYSRWCLLALFPLVFSCNKTDDFEDLPLLIGKSWALISVNEGGNLLTDDCYLDDILRFEDLTNFNYSFGSSLCDESENLRRATHWELKKNHTEIKFDFEIQVENRSVTGHEYWEIVALSESELILKNDGGKDDIVRVYEH